MWSRKTIVFIFGILMLLNVLHNSPLFAGELAENSITIVYNNVPGNTAADVRVGGGFSAFIVFGQERILFDVGGDASILMNNVRALDLDFSNLNAVLISHNHWDHVYGLPGIYAFVESNPGVYVPSSSKDAILQQYPRADVLPVEEPVEIFPDVWSTGIINLDYRGISLSEQALVLDNDDSLYIVTGCAHPGIVSFVERVKQLFPEKSIALLAGGFHLGNAKEEEIKEISTALKILGVNKIAPSHCTGRAAMQIFEQEWGEQYLRLYLGDTHRL
jgi:7,8-dihydropterin-6-yl-methyl-4-(beta-D-ribofuranosyl)aminobenzene 5'-phosphate synthase